MKIKNALVITALLLAGQPMQAIGADVDPEAHKFCLDAKDYEGCIRVKTGQLSKPTAESQQLGVDILGMPKIKGWIINEVPQRNVVTYINPEITKVKVRGVYGRYFHIERVVRIFRNPKAGTSGSTTTIGSSKTTCYSTTDNSINCTTQPPTTINMPGSSAVPGGVRQFYYDFIVDCADGTMAAHVNGKVNTSWRSVRDTFGEPYSKKFCPNVDSLPESNFRHYAGGSPDAKDRSYQ